MTRAEALLPDTEALPTNCTEMIEHKGKWLVRVRDAKGTTTRQTFPLTGAGRDEAHLYLLAQAQLLAKAVNAET